jgi:hypothetical protein
MYKMRHEDLPRTGEAMSPRQHLQVAVAILITLWLGAATVYWMLMEPRDFVAAAHVAVVHLLGSASGTAQSGPQLVWSTAVLVLGFAARVYGFSVIALYAVKPYVDRRVRDAYAHARVANAEASPPTPGTPIRSRSLMN